MVLEGKYWGYTKTEEGKRCNEWRVARAENTDCTFPSEKRIKELGLSLLGTTEAGENRFLGVRRWQRKSIYSCCLLLQIQPKTDREKIRVLVAAIGSETK